MLVKLWLKNEEHAEDLLQVFDSDSDWYVLDEKDTNRPDLIIYEIDPGKEEDLQEVENIIKERIR